MKRIRRLTAAAAAAAVLISTGAAVAAPAATPAPLPTLDHIVIVMLENKRYDAVVGHPKTPWVTSLARRWANMTRFYAETHPSQPNYLALFSGSTQGVTDNNCPHDLGARPNLGRQLIDAGYTFTGYSEGLPGRRVHQLLARPLRPATQPLGQLYVATCRRA